jgi:hypothetical protein
MRLLLVLCQPARRVLGNSCVSRPDKVGTLI